MTVLPDDAPPCAYKYIFFFEWSDLNSVRAFFPTQFAPAKYTPIFSLLVPNVSFEFDPSVIVAPFKAYNPTDFLELDPNKISPFAAIVFPFPLP